MILAFFGGAEGGGGGRGACCETVDAGTELGRLASSWGKIVKGKRALAGDCKVAVRFCV